MIEKAEMWKHGQVKCQEWVGIAFYGGWAWGLVGVDGNIYNSVWDIIILPGHGLFFFLQNIFRDFWEILTLYQKVQESWIRTCDKCWEWVGVAILGGSMMRELEERCTGTERWTVHGMVDGWGWTQHPLIAPLTPLCPLAWVIFVQIDLQVFCPFDLCFLGNFSHFCLLG